MKKPEILIGEVKEFIDIIRQFTDLDKGFNNTSFSMIKWFVDFYSQPFKPEMITEYFIIDDSEFDDGGGWFKVSGQSFAYGNGENGEDIYNCETLEHFISDFNRISNIKLTWRN